MHQDGSVEFPDWRIDAPHREGRKAFDANGSRNIGLRPY
jgi:hypothetical protein